MRRILHSVSASLLPFSLLGCTVLPTYTPITVPQDIAAHSTQLNVLNRSKLSGIFGEESFDVGPYHVAEVKRNWSAVYEANTGVLKEKKSQGGFLFRYSTPQTKWSASCGKHSEVNTLKIRSLISSESRSILSCTCHNDSRKTSFFVIDEMSELHGRILIDNSGDTTEYNLHQYSYGNFSTGGVAPAIGFRIDSLHANLGYTGVAAVEVLTPGKIWFNKQLSTDQQDALACPALALILNGSK